MATVHSGIEQPPLIDEHRYDTLPDGEFIRILHLLPGTPDDYIRCKLEAIALKEAWRTYECISYVWGDPSDRRWIIVDGMRMSVGLSLFQALQHFRHETKTKRLWADAICIMQTNPPEKGRQVQLMGRIYEEATQVNVWLGPDTLEIAQEAFDFIKETSQIGRVLGEKYGGLRKIPVLPDAENPVSQDKEKWKLWETFLALSWFNRVWVIQEVGIAAHAIMHWGDAEINFSDIINTNEFLFYAQRLFKISPISWSLHDAYVSILNWYSNTESWRSQLYPDLFAESRLLSPCPNFPDILIQSSRRNVTDMRDYVYAFLGHPLAQRNGEFIVRADYTKDLDDVYLQVAVKLYDWFGPASPLGITGGLCQRQPRDLDGDLPSWVPRWELSRRTGTLGRPGHWFYAGGKGLEPQAKVDVEKKTLTMSGVVFDTVVWASKPIPVDDVNLDMLLEKPKTVPALTWIWEVIKDQQCRYPEEDRHDAMTVTLVAGRYKNDLQSEDDLPRHRTISAAFQKYVEVARESNDEIDPQLRADARDYEDAHAWTAHDKCFFLTEKGFYGVGTPQLKKGDSVAVSPGLLVPLNLRHVAENKYKLVGVCYVHGVMRGELFDLADPLGLQAGQPGEIVII